MTGNQQRAALQGQIWKIANDVRGAVDGWDFKQYVLGTLFYRFISENFASYIEADDDSIDYARLVDDVITPAIKDDAIKTSPRAISVLRHGCICKPHWNISTPCRKAVLIRSSKNMWR